MNRTGNTIGAEGRRQHNENDPQNGDRQRMQERLADREIEEGLNEVAAGDDEGDAVEAAGRADHDADSDDVDAPEGVKPVTESRIDEAVEDEARE